MAAQQQQNITIAAPGFKGVNTELSPLSLPPEWAKVADNCVIDKFGRVGSRNGYTVFSTSNSPLSSNPVTAIKRYYDPTAAAYKTFTTGNNKIMEGVGFTDVTPVAATVTADDWQITQLGDDLYFIQDGHDMCMWDSSAASCLRVTDHGSAASVPSGPSCGVGAFGKLWVGSGSMLYWSDTLIGPAFSGGASGSINLQTVWPSGYDEIVSISEFNNFLVIFGSKSIIIYDGAASPATMAVSDTVDGIGCAARDSVVSIGSDLLFLDANGVRSLGRTIQEKSSPIGDISSNVHTDVITALRANEGLIRAEYSGNHGFYLLSFPTTLQVFCFDLRTGRLEDGSARTTVWTGVPWTAFDDYENVLYVGNYDGWGVYEGYVDGTDTYRMRYYSHPQTFGSSATLKFPKQLDYIIVGGNGQQVSLLWGYGYSPTYKSKSFTLDAGAIYEYGVAEYGIAEYAISAETGTPHVNTTGSGKMISVGFECTINGTAVSLQEINLQTLIGRIV